MTESIHPRGLTADSPAEATSLGSRRGVAILLLLSLVQFMDMLDASILNIALPSIKHDLGFSQQSLQWVVDGYILTYGGFLLLGARMADLLGRRLVLVTGLVVFAGSSLAGGLAHTSSLLVGARFAQGVGAAMLSPGRPVDADDARSAPAASATPRSASGGRSPASAAPPASSSEACSRRGPAGAGCCSSTSPSARSRSLGAFALLRRERDPRTAGELRRPRSAARHRRHAAPRLRAREGAGRRLGHDAHDRRAGRLRR